MSNNNRIQVDNEAIQQKSIEDFKNEFKAETFSNKDLEKFILRAGEIGNTLELRQIKEDLIDKIFMTCLNFSDPYIVQNVLSLLPEFIYYCSNRDDSGDGSRKTIPIPNFQDLLIKIIDDREHDKLEDLLNEIVSLIFVLDEQNEGASACVSAMNFAILLFKSSALQFRCALGVRLMAILIKSRIDISYEMIFDNIISVCDPSVYPHDPFVRKHGYLAMKDIFSRKGEKGDFRTISSEHSIFLALYNFLDSVSLENSNHKSRYKSEVIAKAKNVIKISANKSTKIVEMDPWVQGAFIQLIPFMKQEQIKRYMTKDFFEKIKTLSWNIQLAFVNMLRTSVDVLKECRYILGLFFHLSEQYSDLQTSCILSMMHFLDSPLIAVKDKELLLIQRKENEQGLTIIKGLNQQIDQSLNNKSDEATKFIHKIIPLVAKIIPLISNTKHDSELMQNMNMVSVNDDALSCRLYLNPFYITYCKYNINILNEFLNLKADKVFKNLLQSNDDYTDRLYLIEQINLYFDSENLTLVQKATTMVIPFIELVSNDPIYVVRDAAIQTLIKLSINVELSLILDHICNIYPGACFNGKKSLLALTASIIVSIDPFENPEQREFLFSNYIDKIFKSVTDLKNKMLQNYFIDLLQSIWPLLPNSIKEQYSFAK